MKRLLVKLRKLKRSVKLVELIDLHFYGHKFGGETYCSFIFKVLSFSIEMSPVFYTCRDVSLFGIRLEKDHYQISILFYSFIYARQNREWNFSRGFFTNIIEY